MNRITCKANQYVSFFASSLIYVLTPSQGFAIIDGQLYSDPNFGVLPADGISDLWQNTYGIDPFWEEGHPLHPDSDFDGDQISNIDEYYGGTDPYDAASFLFSEIAPSTTVSGEYLLTLDLTAYYDYRLVYTETLLNSFIDIDALTPALNYRNYEWPLTATTSDTGFWRVSVMPADSDNDGLLDFEEVDFVGTNPLEPDADGDGVLDGVEFAQGSDPQNRSDSFDNAGQLYYNSPKVTSFLRVYAESDDQATNPTVTGALERVGSPNQLLLDRTLPIEAPGVILDIGANLLAKGILYDYTVSYTNLVTPQPFRYKLLLPHEYQGGTTEAIAVEVTATPPTIVQVPGLIPPFFVASSEAPSTRILYGAITLQLPIPIRLQYQHRCV